jgi:hypothetical protein
MNDLIINVEKSTRMVLLTKTTIGNEFENLQEKITFKFLDTFVDGQGRLEYKINGKRQYIPLTKENDTYTLSVQNVLTQEGKIEMQLVITEGTEEENIPVFKSNVFYLYCNRSLNAVSEALEGYDLWIEQANAKLNAMDEALAEVDNLDIDASKSGDTATISITNKEGVTKSVEIYDGVAGKDGKDGEAGPANTLSIGTVTKGDQAGATITGESPNQTLNLVLPKGDKGEKGDKGNTGNDGYSPSASVTQFSGGATITITDKRGTTTATITSGEQGPEGPAGKDGANGKDGADAKINGVNALNIEAGTNITLDQVGSTLTINSTGGSGGTSDYEELENQPKVNNVTLKGNKTSSDLGLQPAGNYALKSEIPTVPTNVSAFTNDAGYLTTHQDLTGYVTNTDYATYDTGGVVKVSVGDHGLNLESGTLKGVVKTLAQYNDMSSKGVISKGTLENVLADRIGDIETALGGI